VLFHSPPPLQVSPELIPSPHWARPGYLKGTISASDIKKLKLEPSDQPEEMLQKMFVPVSYFLTSSPLTCTMDHSLEDVLGAMTANKYVATPHLMAMAMTMTKLL
jgi:CBS domain-containing protein